MFAFSSNENAVLERKADIGEGSRSVATRDIDSYYELDKCAEWTKKNELNKVVPLFFVFLFCCFIQATFNCMQSSYQKKHCQGSV